jgi:Ca2+-binding RTX toxin-like protein
MAYDLTGLQILMGTPASETLTGSPANEAIFGIGGTDTLGGGRGTDILFGGVVGTIFVYSADGSWADALAAPGNALLANLPDSPYPLSSYGQSHDVFVGTGGGNTLTMGNGRRALFLDDPWSPGIDALRLVNIQTIVGGSGGQIIDLASQTSSYGDVTIQGGSGHDVLRGSSGHDTIAGGRGNDRIWGGAGDDILDGGIGSDRMTGGSGHDTYAVNSSGDIITEHAGEGLDTVHASVSYTLGEHLETLLLTGKARNATGNPQSNVLIGNALNNRLDGGAGADVMIGHEGNDTYIVDDAGDLAIENGGEGTDHVRATVSFALGAHIERLSLDGAADINGTGNDLNNLIIGNAGRNVLDGRGGADTMIGRAGDDIYMVDHAGDRVSERNNEGTDIVHASISFTLGAYVENLTLAGLTAINATGNGLDNNLTGNAADNVLNGRSGADTMIGGAGNDTYFVNVAGDAVVEQAGEGTDTVISSINHSLSDHVENLVLAGGAQTGTGNALDNIITGNGRANILWGARGMTRWMARPVPIA